MQVVKTRKALLELGAKEGHGWDLWLNGVRWIEKPSENGNGWFLGDCTDTDNLCMVQDNE